MKMGLLNQAVCGFKMGSDSVTQDWWRQVWVPSLREVNGEGLSEAFSRIPKDPKASLEGTVCSALQILDARGLQLLRLALPKEANQEA
mmetsp:Transcript_8235/g.30951  ORF Transcript_8235/g.30951 Transcript_8235/m.30951 type:complete len:88 (-) Transcript_8235:1191-1454(-)